MLLLLACLFPLSCHAFVTYIRMSNQNESGTNLRNLYQGAAIYYALGSVPRGFDPRRSPAASPRACTVANAQTHNSPGPTKSVIDLSRESSSFRAIGFSVGDPVYFQYAIARSPGSFCGVAPGADLYRFQARGDFDGDGVLSFHELAAGSDEDNVLVRAPGIYIARQGE